MNFYFSDIWQVFPHTFSKEKYFLFLSDTDWEGCMVQETKLFSFRKILMAIFTLRFLNNFQSWEKFKNIIWNL